MLQMLVYEGQRRRRWCATANSSRNSATQTTVRHTHMLQMLNVCDANDRAKQIYTYRHMLQMLVYEGLRHRRWCASARNTCRYFMQMKRADTVCYNIVRLRCKRRCNTETCIERLRRRRWCATDRHTQIHHAHAMRLLLYHMYQNVIQRIIVTVAGIYYHNIFRRPLKACILNHRSSQAIGTTLGSLG